MGPVIDALKLLLADLPTGGFAGRNKRIVATTYGTIRLATRRDYDASEIALAVARYLFNGAVFIACPSPGDAAKLRKASMAVGSFKVALHTNMTRFQASDVVRGLKARAVIAYDVDRFSVSDIERLYDGDILECFGDDPPRYVLLG